MVATHFSDGLGARPLEARSDKDERHDWFLTDLPGVSASKITCRAALESSLPGSGEELSGALEQSRGVRVAPGTSGSPLDRGVPAQGWCKDKWGVSWQITPRVLTEALAAGGDEAKRAFDAMMGMKKIDVAAIKAARRG
jgi:hypothetical protein